VRKGRAVGCQCARNTPLPAQLSRLPTPAVRLSLVHVLLLLLLLLQGWWRVDLHGAHQLAFHGLVSRHARIIHPHPVS
jgi:hypothetical protein